MLMNQQLEDGNFGSEQINNSTPSSEEEPPTGLSALIKKQLKVLVVAVEQSIRRVVEDDNFRSEQSNNSSEEELIGLSALIKKELEVLVIRTVEQSIKPILEPMIRTVMKEEIKSAIEKILPSMNQNSGNEIHPLEQRNLRLRFLNNFSLHIMTGDQIKGEDGDSIKVALFDDLTGLIVDSGPLASAKVEIVILKGDFEGDGEDWTLEEFNQKIVIESDGKRSLLTGKTFLNLKEGVGVLDEISLKHNSNWLKSCELRLGARVVDNIPNGTRVREAKTVRFNVKDRRNNLYKKHHPPALIDEVWRLEKIGKDGAFHKRLSREKVNTVKDFLTLLFLDPARLRNILGTGMSDKVWEVTVDHARTCILDKKLYSYCFPGSQKKTGVVFSVVGQLMGLLSERHYVPIDKLSKTKKTDALDLVISAFQHWGDVDSFDNDAYLVDGYSGLSNVLYPPISSMRASSDGKTSVVEGSSCPPIAENHSNFSQFETGGCNFISSLTVDVNDYGFGDHYLHDFENNPVQATNSSFCDPVSSTQPFLRQVSFNFDSLVNTQNPNSESHGYLQSVVDGGAMLKAQRKKTKYPSKVLLRFISLQVVTLKRIRAAKRPRLC